MSTIIDRRVFAGCLAFLLVVPLGCSDDVGEPHSLDTDHPYAPATTPEILMDNFETAYANMDFDGYPAMLHDDFKFIFLPGEGPSDFFTRAEDLGSTTNLFSGEPHTNPDGVTTRGISSITVERCDPVEPWEPVAETYPYFGDHAANGAEIGYYDVKIVLTHSQGTITIDSKQFFFAIPVEVLVDGETQTVWKLLGQQDSDLDKNAEQRTWGELKALFR